MILEFQSGSGPGGGPAGCLSDNSMTSKYQKYSKTQNLDKNRNFDQLGVKIELWAIDPKRCARSTYVGNVWRQIPKIPNCFPKNCI